MYKVWDLTHIIWNESWVKIYPNSDEDNVLYEGYMLDVPESLYDRNVDCIVPCVDRYPFVGIELVD